MAARDFRGGLYKGPVLKTFPTWLDRYPEGSRVATSQQCLGKAWLLPPRGVPVVQLGAQGWEIGGYMALSVSLLP
jgi:hypothetical protein